MTDYTALVEAGEALVALLRASITPEPIGNPEAIALASPHENEESNQLTVFMFQIEPDANNTQAGYYQVSRDVQRIRPSYFGLYYLITSHSKAPVQMREADQYRVLGAVIQTLIDNPVIPKRFMTGSLADAGIELHLAQQRTNLDEMMKIWNNNANRYKLSIVVKVESVPMSSRRERRVGRVGEVIIGSEVKDDTN